MRRFKSKKTYEKWLNSCAKATGVFKLNCEKKREEYFKNPKLCKNCNASLPFYEHNKRKFCSHRCAASYNNVRKKAKERKCIMCGETIFGTTSKKYCIKHTAYRLKEDEYIVKWLSGEISGSQKRLPLFIRRWIFKQKGKQCWECGWSKINIKTGMIPLQVHHKDGNALNNRPENLELICPNCHSLTINFGSLNNGNGRSWRKQ